MQPIRAVGLGVRHHDEKQASAKGLLEDPNPPKRHMPAFLASLVQANQNIICTAKGEDVRKASISDLLRERLRVPIFQRRYCWGEDQWKTLLSDALLVANGTHEKHSLGRITCTRCGEGDRRLLVIDGQQRNTTCSLLLAALRDLALREHPDDPVCRELASHLSGVLLPDAAGLDAWRSRCAAAAPRPTVVRDGESLEFAALIPTYCDRASYFAAILPPCLSAEAASGEWQRPMEAKEYFLRELKQSSAELLASLAEVVLDKLEWLLFPINTSGEHHDGTENLQVIYERLAVRDATWCKPHRSTEFASMGAADFVRNLVLGSFRRESDAIYMYKQHWLPIEQAAAAASSRRRSRNIAQALEGMLTSFLNAQPEKSYGATPIPVRSVVVGGHLYPRFRQWLSAALADLESVEGEDVVAELERRTAMLLQRMHAFALEDLAADDAPVAAALTGPRPAAPMRGEQCSCYPLIDDTTWRCARCSFKNPASASTCTACNLTRP